MNGPKPALAITNKMQVRKFLRHLNGRYAPLYSLRETLQIIHKEEKNWNGRVEVSLNVIHLVIDGAGVVLRFIRIGDKWQQENLSV